MDIELTDMSVIAPNPPPPAPPVPPPPGGISDSASTPPPLPPLEPELPPSQQLASRTGDADTHPTAVDVPDVNIEDDEFNAREELKVPDNQHARGRTPTVLATLDETGLPVSEALPVPAPIVINTTTRSALMAFCRSHLQKLRTKVTLHLTPWSLVMT